MLTESSAFASRFVKKNSVVRLTFSSFPPVAPRFPQCGEIATATYADANPAHSAEVKESSQDA